MSTLKALTIANMTDASLIEAAAVAVKGSEASGLRGILTAALFLRVKGDSKETAAMLFLGFKAVTTEGSANNYVSKSRAAAMGDHFKWSVDVNQPLAEVVDAILPEFVAYWGSVNGIKKSGPGKAEPKARAAKKAEEQAEKPLALVEATPGQLVEHLAARLSEMTADGVRTLDTATLVALRDAITAEIEARAAEASGMIKRAA